MVYRIEMLSGRNDDVYADHNDKHFIMIITLAIMYFFLDFNADFFYFNLIVFMQCVHQSLGWIDVFKLYYVPYCERTVHHQLICNHKNNQNLYIQASYTKE